MPDTAIVGKVVDLTHVLIQKLLAGKKEMERLDECTAAVVPEIAVDDNLLPGGIRIGQFTDPIVERARPGPRKIRL